MQRLLFLLAPLLAAAEPGPAPRVVRLDLDRDILPPGVIARLGSNRFQDVSAHRVTISPDGSRAICVDNCNVRVWDLKSGKVVHVWPLPENTLDLWPQRRFDERTSPHFVGSVSEDGRTAVRLRQQSDDDGVTGVADVWDLPTGRNIRSLSVRGTSAFAAAAVSQDGATVVTADHHPRPFRIRAWDLRTGQGRVLGAHDGQILQLHFIDGGRKVLAVVYDNDAVAHDLQTGKEVYRVPLPPRFHLTLARGGKRFILYEHPSSLIAYDAVTGKQVSGLKYPTEDARPRALSDDGATLLCYWTSHSAIYDLAAGKKLLELPAHSYATAAFGADCKTVIFAGDGLWVSNATTGQVLAGPDPARGPPGLLGAFGWASDGSSLLVAGAHRTGNTVFDPRTGKMLRELKPDAVVSRWFQPGLHSAHHDWEDIRRLRPQLPFSPRMDAKGNSVHGHAITSGDDRLLAVRFYPPDFSRPVEMTNMPRQYWRPKNCFNVAVHERATGAELFKVEIPAVGEVAFSLDNRRLATLEPDRLRVWDAVSGKLLVEHKMTRPDRPPRGEGFGSALAFSPDSRRLAVNNRDGTILIWDVAVPEEPDRPSAADLPRLWDDLSASDPKVGWRAAHSLASIPDRALPFLLERVKPASRPDAATTEKLLVDLDSPAYRTREAAMKRVLDLGDAAKPFIDGALKYVASPELRKRLEELQATFHEGDPARGDDLRCLRALYVLERTATKETRAKIEELTTGLPAARVTLEAKLVRQRMVDRERAETE